MGAVVVSLDAELAWGYHDLDPLPEAKFLTARESWTWLVDALAEHSIPATWAIVGHLFLDGCDGRHADHAAPEGWFRRDPGGSAGEQPLWFGPDLVEAVLDSPVDHEIASHSFSHVEFDAADVSPEVARAEVGACVDVAAEWGLDLESFVFPRNGVGHLDVLADLGFRNYRALPPRRPATGSFGRAGKAVDYALGLTDPAVDPPSVDEHGLVRHTSSQYLFAFEEPARSLVGPVNSEPVLDRVRRGLDRAARTDGVFHLWFHPNELRSEADYERVRAALAAIDRRRERDGLEVATMATAGERVRQG